MADHTSRRTFLRVVGAALGGAAVGACAGGAPGARADSSSPADSGDATASRAAGRQIGIQLYTLRSLMERNVESTLASVADIGYREVEFAGYFGRDPKQLRATLDRLQLTAPSAHIPLTDLRSKLPATLAAAETLGHRYIVCPYVDDAERTAAGYRKLADEFNRWGAACRERGIRFAYHNHDFEFKPAGDIAVPYDFLLAQTDPASVAMELDLYWTTYAGRDPLTYFQKHRGRFPLWHVKDLRDMKGAKEIVPVGDGEIDFRRIFASAEQAGLDHFFVEQDNAADKGADPIENVRKSFQNVRSLVA
jgi:sugar phosphate isomerase/epimerase